VEAQGYTIEESEFFQDNMSAMNMEKNGRSSAGQRSRHINIRYFFIRNRIQQGEINLLHYPTGIMIVDFFTKPLQGALFTKFRDITMGTTHFSTLTAPDLPKPRSVLKRPVSKETISKEKTLPSTGTVRVDVCRAREVPTKNVSFRSLEHSKDSSCSKQENG
jgi:hypothetical protein